MIKKQLPPKIQWSIIFIIFALVSLIISNDAKAEEPTKVVAKAFDIRVGEMLHLQGIVRHPRLAVDFCKYRGLFGNTLILRENFYKNKCPSRLIGVDSLKQ